MQDITQEEMRKLERASVPKNPRDGSTTAQPGGIHRVAAEAGGIPVLIARPEIAPGGLRALRLLMPRAA